MKKIYNLINKQINLIKVDSNFRFKSEIDLMRVILTKELLNTCIVDVYELLHCSYKDVNLKFNYDANMIKVCMVKYLVVYLYFFGYNEVKKAIDKFDNNIDKYLLTGVLDQIPIKYANRI